jgi:hypothetical protein
LMAISITLLKDPLAMPVVEPKLAFGSADSCWLHPPRISQLIWL